MGRRRMTFLLGLVLGAGGMLWLVLSGDSRAYDDDRIGK